MTGPPHDYTHVRFGFHWTRWVPMLTRSTNLLGHALSDMTKKEKTRRRGRSRPRTRAPAVASPKAHERSFWSSRELEHTACSHTSAEHSRRASPGTGSEQEPIVTYATQDPMRLSKIEHRCRAQRSTTPGSVPHVVFGPEPWDTGKGKHSSQTVRDGERDDGR